MPFRHLWHLTTCLINYSTGFSVGGMYSYTVPFVFVSEKYLWSIVIISSIVSIYMDELRLSLPLYLHSNDLSRGVFTSLFIM